MQQSQDSRLVACSPNKLSFSKVLSIRPGKRLLTVGFETVSKTAGRANLEKLDSKLKELAGNTTGKPVLIEIEDAVDLLRLAYENLVFDDPSDDEHEAHITALRHLSQRSASSTGKVKLLAVTDRSVKRFRESGRLSDAPDTKQQAAEAGGDIPLLIMLRQNGAQTDGWRDLPFWWPVIIPPAKAVTSIFADEAPSIVPSPAQEPAELTTP